MVIGISRFFFILVRKVYLLDTLCLEMKEFFVGFITVKKSWINEVYVWLHSFLSQKLCSALLPLQLFVRCLF